MANREFIDGLADKSVVYYAGHGSTNSFLADKTYFDQVDIVTGIYPSGGDGYYPTQPSWLVSIGVEPYRVAHIGTGAPPINSTGNPAIALAFLVACCTASSNDFIRFCIPYLNAYGYWLEDQAYTGFNTQVYTDEEDDITEAAFSVHSNGNTLMQARVAVAASGVHAGNDHHLLQISDMPIYGDPYLRLRTVYTGNNDPPAGWYRSP